MSTTKTGHACGGCGCAAEAVLSRVGQSMNGLTDSCGRSTCSVRPSLEMGLRARRWPSLSKNGAAGRILRDDRPYSHRAWVTVTPEGPHDPEPPLLHDEVGLLRHLLRPSQRERLWCVCGTLGCARHPSPGGTATIVNLGLPGLTIVGLTNRPSRRLASG